MILETSTIEDVRGKGGKEAEIILREYFGEGILVKDALRLKTLAEIAKHYGLNHIQFATLRGRINNEI